MPAKEVLERIVVECIDITNGNTARLEESNSFGLIAVSVYLITKIN